MPISTIDLSKAVSSTNSYQIDYLVVAGGGAGGYDVGGGGGAGGYLSASCSVFINATYPVVVGAGGTGTANGNTTNAGNGQNSSFGGFALAIGGGGGGNWDAFGIYNKGLNGGSGGGGGGYQNVSLQGYPSAGNQGFAGGPATTNSVNQSGGGGGGAGGIGSTSSAASVTGFVSGGPGLTWYDGITYARGGKGSADGYTGATAGAANTGDGGDGQGSGSGASPAGGSGIVIVRYAGAQRGTGGTVTSSGGYTYHKFTSSGTFTA